MKFSTLSAGRLSDSPKLLFYQARCRLSLAKRRPEVCCSSQLSQSSHPQFRIQWSLNISFFFSLIYLASIFLVNYLPKINLFNLIYLSFCVSKNCISKFQFPNDFLKVVPPQRWNWTSVFFAAKNTDTMSWRSVSSPKQSVQSTDWFAAFKADSFFLSLIFLQCLQHVWLLPLFVTKFWKSLWYCIFLLKSLVFRNIWIFQWFLLVLNWVISTKEKFDFGQLSLIMSNT